MFSHRKGISVACHSLRSLSQLLPFANQRSLEDVQRMINRLQKQNDAFNVFFKNQISMNFEKFT